MNNNINPSEEYEITVSDRTSPEFLESAQAVSDYLKDLPLTTGQNNRLIELICKNMGESDRGAFKKGIEVGVAIGKEIAE